MEEIKTLGEEKAPAVIKDLLTAVVDVKPAPHRNAAPPV